MQTFAIKKEEEKLKKSVGNVATLKEVAEYVGVSASTVSRALNRSDMVDKKTRDEILEACSKLGYKPNLMARALKEGKSKIIAFMIPNIENEIYPTLAAAVEEAADQRGYLVLLCNTRENQEKEMEYVNRFLGQSASGFLYSTAMINSEQKSIHVLDQLKIPVVYLMREPKDKLDSFVSDAQQGGYLATSYLIQKGYRNIVTLTGRDTLPLYQQRRKGYQEALEEAGVKFDAKNVWNCVENGVEHAREVMEKKLKQSIIPDAIFAESDPLAFDAILALNKAGYRVPEDVSVIGFDDISMAENFKLTTIHQPLKQMAKDAVNRLIDMIEGKIERGQPQKVYPLSIVERSTVKK